MVSSISVLCVDDESAILEVMRKYLERRRPAFEVRTARDPNTAVSIVREDTVDCVVADYEMPTVDGLELLELVRDHDPDLPFIMYTGRGSEAVASEAISAGVTDYLRKDRHTDQYDVLANRIKNAVEARREAEKRAESERELTRYETLVETVGDPMYVLDENGVCQLANEALAEYTGYNRSDLEGAHFSQFIAEEDYEDATAQLLSMTDSSIDQETLDIQSKQSMGGNELPRQRYHP
ncbi:MAG: response regulator [Natrialbaceae archaeon]|nr:response regulator [Natrialbaceae archaeon]